MKNNKYKILVLSDLKDNTKHILKNSASLSKIIGGEVSLFHVKKPTDIVDRESQLSAFRTISEKHSLTKKSVETFVKNAEAEHDIAINYSYTFGNVKNEIEDYISKNKPDIIVLGKRKHKPISFGNNITDFVLKTFNGVIMISGEENLFEPNQELSLGVLNNSSTISMEFSETLLAQTQSPLKAFKFIKQNSKQNNVDSSSKTKTVDYVFEHNDNTIKNLSNYLLKTNINLLYLDRENNKDTIEGLKWSDIKGLINNLNISILLSSRQKLQTNTI